MRFSRQILNCIFNKNNLTKSIHLQLIREYPNDWYGMGTGRRSFGLDNKGRLLN